MGVTAAVPDGTLDVVEDPDVAATEDEEDGRGTDDAAPDALSQGFGGDAIAGFEDLLW